MLSSKRLASRSVCLRSHPSPRAAYRLDHLQAPKRFVALFWPNGSTLREDWQLGGSGSNYTMGTAHDALIPFQSKLSMFKNLNYLYGRNPSHGGGTIEFLTGAPISNMTTPVADISVDQAIADELAPPTPVRSMHLGPPPYGYPPGDGNWPSGYFTNVSWSSPTAPNAPLEHPQVAFDQLFSPGGDPGDGDRRRVLRQSVLDHTLDQIQAIKPRLGNADSHKLDEYLTAIRDVETTLQGSGGGTVSGDCESATGPGTGLDFPSHTQAMLDIIALALRCDATRLITYSMDYGFGNQSLDFLGYTNFAHHNLSHGGGALERVNAHKHMVRWYMEQVAYLLGKLDAVDEGGDTMLDNSIVYVGADVGEAWGHDTNDITLMLAGGGAGALDPGRLIDASGVSYDSVLLALAHAMDANLPSFSGASTPFAGL